MKILPVGAEWFRADGQTDKTKLTVAFRNLAEAPTKEALLLVTVPQAVLLSHAPVNLELLYRGADKYLARPGRKQARKHVKDARDFNIETRAVIKFPLLYPSRKGAEGNSRHSDKHQFV